ncbi:multidrug ABC transporter permease [Mangrovactinospora gilvigrisea]|uniref:Transport permease protein n=1 Tax=Mangrovactinospora gilvigrisea TaxID=1428644 RepID=A0A1J7CA89_9ACTN|nr:multidrug ABC transporter permease [Mangrovactinospora gilvigrisea]
MGTVFTHGRYLTGRRLRAVLRQPAFVGVGLVQPVIWMFLFGQLFKKIVDLPGFGSGNYLDFLVPGVVAMNAMNGAMWAGMGAMEEIQRGTLDRFLTAPTSRVALMTATVAEMAVTTAAQTAIILVLGRVGGAHYPGGAAGIAVVVAASVLVGTVFGGMSNAIGMTVREREAIIGVNVFLMLPLTFLSSAFMAPTLMPSWMRHIAACNPVDWAVRSGRLALAAHPDWPGVAWRLGALAALAVAAVALSVLTFRSYQRSV